MLSQILGNGCAIITSRKINCDWVRILRKYVMNYFLFLAFLLLSLVGCSATGDDVSKVAKEESPDVASEGHAYHAENGDLREVTSAANVMPTFLMDKNEQMQTIYGAAAHHHELLEYIPCYCGCAESGNHKNALNCFVYEIKENGEVVWDDHGTRCDVCLETAAESIIQYQEGKSVKEIRDYIDDKYKDGYPEPTPTKLPEEV